MTHPTNEELDAFLYMHPGYRKPYPIEVVLRDSAAQEGCDGEPYDAMVFAAYAIMALRAQCDEAMTERDAHKGNADDCYAKWAEANARADRAEAALAAQIEADAGVCDKNSYSNNQYVSMRMIDAAREIRAQPHDRAALARYRETVLRDAADACDWGDIYGDNAVRAILYLIKQEKK